jgi:two-component system cell cycle response regulator
MTHKIVVPNDLNTDILHLANSAINSANDGITIADITLPDQPLIFVNEAFEIVTGYASSEIIGKNCRFLQGNMRNQPGVELISQAIHNNKKCRVVLKNFKKDGSLFWNELSLSPIIEKGKKIQYYVGVQKDVTNEVVLKEKIIYLSEHDDLTGLYNYRGFFSQLSQFTTQLTTNGLLLGIGIVDINFFKEINDKHGHVKGNNVLTILSSEFMDNFGSNAIISRFGGDEFCFATAEQDTNTDRFYEKIANSLKATNSALSSILQISISAGVYIDKASEKTRLDRSIHLADKIMYANKQTAHLDRFKKLSSSSDKN